jgi:hypothetical protein
MKRIVRLTEGDLIRLVKRVIKESTMTTVPEDLKKKIMECATKTMKPEVVMNIMIKYPTLIEMGVEIMNGELNVTKIPAALKEIQNTGITTQEFSMVSELFLCIGSSMMGGFKLPPNPFGF